MAEEVGTLTIKGEINETDLSSSLDRLSQTLDNFENKNKSSMADMSRMTKITQGLKTSLLGVAGAAGTAMLGLATGSSAVAPSLARMKISAFELGETVGEDLRPGFEKAGEMFANFVSFMEEHPTVRKFTEAIAGLGLAAGALKLVGLGSVLTAIGSGLATIAPYVLVIGGIVAGLWGLLELIGRVLPTKTFKETEIDATNTATGMFLAGRQGTFAPVMEGTGEAFFNEDNMINQLGQQAALDIMKDYDVKNLIYNSVNAEGSSS